jgi:hypothetical protein
MAEEAGGDRQGPVIELGALRYDRANEVIPVMG